MILFSNWNFCLQTKFCFIIFYISFSFQFPFPSFFLCRFSQITNLTYTDTIFLLKGNWNCAVNVTGNYFSYCLDWFIFIAVCVHLYVCVCENLLKFLYLYCVVFFFFFYCYQVCFCYLQNFFSEGVVFCKYK